MKMKALQVDRPREFRQVQVPVPRILEGDEYGVLVHAEWGALCGSDIPFFTGSKRFREYPMLPGAPIHECVGEVVESYSDRFSPGDRVLSIPDDNRGLAEYFPARSTKTVVLPADLEDYGAACLIQPLSTVMNSIDRLGNIEGKSIAVVGLGAMGLLLCWYAAQQGAGSILGIDPCRDRCRLAETLGVDRTIAGCSIEVAHLARRSEAEWDPPDIVIEAVGHQTTTINDCFELVRKYGTVVAFGVPDQNVYAFEYEIFFRKNALLVATVTPDWMDYLERARDLYLRNIEALAPLATPRMTVRDSARAFEMYERHAEGSIKPILDMKAW